MEVGDYVRTKDGCVGKIIDINLGDFQTRYELDNSDEFHYEYKNDIIKSSSNIIDLIEVGDYVNGEIVEEKWKDIVLVGQECRPISFNNIKSIVTKEQFKEMEYKL